MPAEKTDPPAPAEKEDPTIPRLPRGNLRWLALALFLAAAAGAAYWVSR